MAERWSYAILSLTPIIQTQVTPRPGIKREALRLVEQLPEHASWDDLMYEIYVRQAIERGIADADAGRVIPHDEVLARFARPK